MAQRQRQAPCGSKGLQASSAVAGGVGGGRGRGGWLGWLGWLAQELPGSTARARSGSGIADRGQRGVAEMRIDPTTDLRSK